MADPKTPAAGGASTGSASSGPSGGPMAAAAKHLPWWVQFVLDIFGHQAGDWIKAAVSGRADREKLTQVRLPNFGHIMTILQAQNPIVFAQICDLMQFLASDDDRADFQYHVAGIGGDDNPQPSVDFLIQLAGLAQSTGQAGLQEMKDYLLFLGYIGSRAEDRLEKARRYAVTSGKWAVALPGRAGQALQNGADSAATALSDAITSTGVDTKLAAANAAAELRLQRARNRWR